MTEDEIRLAAEALGVIPRSKTRPKSLEVPPGGLSQPQRQTQQTLSEGIKSAAERREAEESEAWGKKVEETTTPSEKILGGLEAAVALPSGAAMGILGQLGEGFKLLPQGGTNQFVAENTFLPRTEAGQRYFDVWAGGVEKAADWFGDTPLGEFLGDAFEKVPGIFPVSASTTKAVDEGLAGAGKGLKLAAEQARKQRQYETGQEGAFYRVRPVTEETGRALRGNKEEAGGGAETPGGPIRGDVPQPITDDALTEIMAQPDNFVRSVASDYAQQVNGRPYELPDMAPSSLLKQAPIGRVFDLAVSENPQYKKAVFEAYGREMPEVIEQSGAKNYDQLVEAAYRQLAKETDDQFRRLPVNMSYHRAGEGNYSDSRDMLRDVYGNRHLYVFQGGDPHPFLSRVDPETGLNDNEKFRAVHDFFGHAIHGNQFGPKGEETAWLAHSQMYSPLARLAMSTETRGQNSVVNYTPLNANLKSMIAEVEGRIYEARRRGQRDDVRELEKIKKELYGGFQFAPQYGLLLPPEMIRPDFAGKMPDYVRPLIQPAPGTATGARLFHYGKEPGIKVTDPSKYGTGIKGAEAARLEGASDIRPRTYFYTDPNKPPEAGLGPYRYTGEADLYDLEEDPLAFRTLAAESLRSPFTAKVNPGMVDPSEAITAAERLVKEYGYPGYMTPGSGTAAVFQPVPVQQYAEGGEVTKEDDPGRLQGLIMLYQAGLLSLDELTKEMRGMHPYDVAKIFGGTDSNPLPEMPTEFSGLERLPFLPYHSYDPERENLTLDDLARLGEGETEEEFKFRGSPNIKRLERTPGFVSSNPSDEIDLATGGAVTMAKGGKVAKGMSGISAAREAMKAQRQTSKNLSKKDLASTGAELETSTGQLPEIAKKYPQIEDASVAASKQRKTPGLEKFLEKSVIKDRVYRGQRRAPAEEGFALTQGRATPSFTLDPEVANVYSRQLGWGTPEYGPGSTVVPAYLQIENPLDIRNLGEYFNLEDFVQKLPEVDLNKPTVENGFGYEDIAQMVRGIGSVANKTGARYEIDASLSGGLYRIKDFNELADAIEEMGSAGKSKEIQNLLFDANIDAFLIGDSKNVRNALRERGFDGVIHKDAFDVGGQYYQGDLNKLEGGTDAEFVHDTYRPFYQEKIKSAVGNVGDYDTTQKAITKAKGGKVTKGALSGLSSAREAMKAKRREERVQKNLEAYMGSTEKPQTYYHATQAPKDFRKFDLEKRPTPKSAAAVFLTPSTDWANEFDMADLKTLESATSAAPRIMPMITRAKNTFDYEDPGHVTQVMNQVELPPGIDRQHVADEIAGGNWNFIEDRNIQKAIKDLGFDSFNVKEKGVKNLGVFNPADVKALFNRGSYDPTTEDISKAAGGPVLKGIAKARAEAKMATGGKAVKGADSALSGIAAARAAQKAQRASKLEEVLEAKQPPMTTPQGTGLPLMPRDQGMYIPGVKQEDLPRMPKVDKARAAGKRPEYTERMEDLLQSRAAKKKVDTLIEKGDALGMREWYGIEPLRQVAMGIGMSPEKFNEFIAQMASASQRNPVDQQNRMGSYLWHLSQTGGLPSNAFLYTNKMRRGKQGLPEGTPIELPSGYGSLAQGDIFNRGLQIARGDIEGALPPDKKLGTFYRNYLGNLRPVTVDVNAVRGPIIERGDPRWLASKLVEKDEEGNVTGTYFPRKAVQSGLMSIKQAKERPGFWEAAPSGSEYAGFEDLWQSAAKRFGIQPAEAQALGWYGSADVTALKTKPELYIDNLERMIRRTAEQTGQNPRQVMENMLRGTEYLRKKGGLVRS